MSLLARLRRLFSPKRESTLLPSPPQAPDQPSSEPPAAPQAPPETAQAPDAQGTPVREEPPRTAPPAAAEAELDEEDVGEEPSEPADEDGDDPFSGRDEPLQISLPTAANVAASRQEMERLALSGAHKVTLVDAAGPGSLAETLARLDAEGRVASEIVDDPESGPYLLYRPR